ncbi:hypothetical protein [Haematospirillum jordaniae]|uniref:Uncharacterized protein n=1 Tax=Haematospirillum jordaniae TaxID=1549855 RepID=A0A143DF55_9PROT|nr:hypothetical protein [Haematospirillum jordaniae]AMW34903.1 hypothetical protein AY555_06585 [Haematospirillum jordaniae]NKD67873.1 hypothetical protein [Haematospirillum jordaniae]NKD81956.1 hypothetical protein [Haematospirillum jordaniae]NKD86438.1 hypothetical protein [Haematospirillum jordaniae]NKD90785.1 hypothetical protein [Haematospirillum jordaniae]
MNRTEFKALCNTHDLDFDEDRRAAYAFIRDEADFTAIKSLLDNESAYLVWAWKKAGQASINYTPYTQIFADDAEAVAREMADRYVELLDEVDGIEYFSADHLERRDQALEANPAQAGESEKGHLERVNEESNDVFPPLDVNESGCWDTDTYSLVFSDAERQEGLWSYSFDQTDYHVVLILNDAEEEDEEEEDAA